MTTLKPRVPRWLEQYATPRAAPKSPPPEGALSVQFWNIPPRLKYLPAWAVWKYELENGRWSKPPYIPPQEGRVPERAEPSDPSTWRSLEAAVRAYKDDREWDGISFALDRRWGVVGVDLDHVSEHKAAADQIVKDLASYTEQTPGRDGLRIFVLGQLPGGRRREWVEMYDQRRFLTVTGQRARHADHIDQPDAVQHLATLAAGRHAWLTRSQGTQPEYLRGLRPNSRTSPTTICSSTRSKQRGCACGHVWRRPAVRPGTGRPARTSPEAFQRARS